MVQAVNSKAILTLATVVRKPSLIVPHISISCISEVPFEALKRIGIEGILLDKDNTITAPYQDERLHPKAEHGVQEALSVFGYDKVAVLSNSAGTLDDPDHKQAETIERSLGLSVVRHEEKKPGGIEEVLKHFGAKESSTICMIGDRLLTDVVFGNLHGMLTVHTLPICSTPEENQQDNWTVKMIRPVENMILYGNWWGGRWLRNQQPSHVYWQPGKYTMSAVNSEH